MTATMQGQVALVTGASRGIGKAIAEQLAAQGVKVIGTATSESGAAAISAYLGEHGEGRQLDVTSADSVAEVLKAIDENYGQLDILVNNAGITKDNLLMRLKDEDWDAVLDTNLKSVYRLSKAVLRGMMKRRHGRIINIASVVGTTGNPGQTNYCAAKAGLLGFSKALAQEVAGRGITVNSVAPGFIDTDMTKALTEEQKQAIFANIPAARLGQPEEIAAAVVFLASPGAAYITGETIHVNGGLAMV
ncbi:3-oxoacyl-ACP reductase FabG [Pseudidiomarina sediminum]|uniref:3-oxoacyl-[acyl-carrier-protein] reductase n=1 Tax=Pseudidiomarina sediminum TaxID=431675 RepID=A0A432Z7X2_9GAMM|nr:3-oxoacyl-ACP reductase FabG [Pseudidiomarina sediminum]MBY6063135.1 3-oxoacyl-ACP reductase FabG [Pseudidiomarina sediminum]RUO73985.1 3-oxoacyl-ACP reductase FabG [Pseudidiomarina sediminum]